MTVFIAIFITIRATACLLRRLSGHQPIALIYVLTYIAAALAYFAHELFDIVLLTRECLMPCYYHAIFGRSMSR